MVPGRCAAPLADRRPQDAVHAGWPVVRGELVHGGGPNQPAPEALAIAMDVLLINTNRMHPPVAPIALDYLAEALAAAGHSPHVLDLCMQADPIRALAGCFAGRTFDLVGLSFRNTDDCYMSGGESFVPWLVQLAAEVRCLTAAPVVVGGAGFSVMPTAILDACGAQFGVWGEGELALPALASNLDRPDRVPGLLWRGGDRWHANPRAFVDPAALPTMTRRWVDNRRYFREGGQLGFETKRGCNQGCAYCADPVARGDAIRVRPPAGVVAEVRALLAMGGDHLHTCDSEFNLPLHHAEAVCDALIAAGLGDSIRWYAYCSPTPFPLSLAVKMRRAGCVGIDFGADSGDASVLARLGRRHTPDDLLTTARTCRKAGLVFMYDLLIGGPGESEASVRATVELMRKAEPDRVGVSVGVRLYPGTPLAAQAADGRLGPHATSLRGDERADPSLLKPVYYLSPALGDRAFPLLADLVGDDPRFFFADPARTDRNYNYNANRLLCDAIARGYRGAYWDILRRLQDGLGPSQ